MAFHRTSYKLKIQQNAWTLTKIGSANLLSLSNGTMFKNPSVIARPSSPNLDSFLAGIHQQDDGDNDDNTSEGREEGKRPAGLQRVDASVKQGLPRMAAS